MYEPAYPLGKPFFLNGTSHRASPSAEKPSHLRDELLGLERLINIIVDGQPALVARLMLEIKPRLILYRGEHDDGDVFVTLVFFNNPCHVEPFVARLHHDVQDYEIG